MRLLRLLLTTALAASTACGGVKPPPRQRTVEIRIHHSNFAPHQLQFSRGEDVRFVIRNVDPIDHEFILGDEEVQSRHETGTDAQHGAVPGEVSISAGEEASTTYRFSRSGRFVFGCHLPGHYKYGMKGTVAITA